MWPDARWKIARRCGARTISKSKCTKHTRFGPLLKVEMSKKCTPLWREAHFEVKVFKRDGVGALLGVQMWFCVAGARDSASCQKWANTWGFCSSFNYKHHYTTLHHTTITTTNTTSLHDTTLLVLHYATLHYTQLHNATLCYTTLTTPTVQLQLQLQL